MIALQCKFCKSLLASIQNSHSAIVVPFGTCSIHSLRITLRIAEVSITAVILFESYSRVPE